jgi:hypothetical protein
MTSVVFALFLEKLSTVCLRMSKEFKRRAEMQYPGWIDAAFVGFVVLLLIGYQGWETLTRAVHELTVSLENLVRWV